MRQLSTDLTRGRSQSIGNNGMERYKHPHLPVLFYLVKARNWAGVLRRCTTHPKEIMSVECNTGDTPLHYACRLDPPKNCIDALMHICNIKNNEGASALHVAASNRCSATVIESLVNTTIAKSSLTLALTKKGRTPLHYACLSFRGLDIDAFKILLEATIATCVSFEKMHDQLEEDDDYDEVDWNVDYCGTEEQVNVFTMQDHLGQTPLSLLFKRYRERVRCVIRMLDERSSSLSPTAATAAVHDELGSLWLKARMIVCHMAEKREEGHFPFEEVCDETSETEAAVAMELSRWAVKQHKGIVYDEDEEDESDKLDRDISTDSKFRLVHASVGLTGFGCPIEMIRLAISVYPNQVKEMDEHGNLPLHIACIASSFLPSDTSPPGCSDEDSFISNLSNISCFSADKHPPFDRVIRMLLRSYKAAAHIPHAKTGKLPLVLAIDTKKRSMDDGLRALIESYPAALETKYFEKNLYPHILSTVGKTKQLKLPSVLRKNESRFRYGKVESAPKDVIPVALYELLRAKPNLLLEKEFV